MKLLKECAQFGRELLATRDLDPIYVMLAGRFPAANRDLLVRPTLSKWVVAYSMFYHAGAATALASQPDELFWGKLEANLDAWPRGAERRHFRGKAARTAVVFARTLRPDVIIEQWSGLSQGGYRLFQRYAAAIQDFPLYGPWITFKLCDIFERVYGLPLVFPTEPAEALATVYGEPAKGAALVVTGKADREATPEQLSSVIAVLKAELGDYHAPPSLDRPIGIQELETILCKFKSHRNGHYTVGKDIREIRHGLNGADWAPPGWSSSELERYHQLRLELVEHLPPNVMSVGQRTLYGHE